MAFFKKITAAFQRFMEGRYGTDLLTLFLLTISVFIQFIVRIFHFPWLSLLPAALVIWGLLRTLSRKREKRFAENERFLHFLHPVIQGIKNRIMRFRDRKTHQYFRCPACHNLLRVPRNGKKIEIGCPVCGKKFVKTTRKPPAN